MKNFTNKQFIKDSFGWGFILWLVGWALGIILFSVAPLWVIGWIITPIGTGLTLLVLFKKIRGDSLWYYALMALIWTLIAIVLDYFFIVKTFAPADGYYKFDVYCTTL